MKFKDKLILLAVAGIAAAGCREEKQPMFDPAAAESALPVTATRKAAEVLANYLRLKDALVASQNDAAASAAGAMRLSLVALLQDGIFEETGTLTVPLTDIQGTGDTLLLLLDQVIGINDKDCERQRVYFKPLSAAMYQLLQETEMTHVMVYRHLCPMAFNEQSAYWLSSSPEVRNPYFGAKMLTCGELTDTIK